MEDGEHHMDYHEDDKRFRREEYESNLMQAGLELERDEDVITSFSLKLSLLKCVRNNC